MLHTYILTYLHTYLHTCFPSHNQKKNYWLISWKLYSFICLLLFHLRKIVITFSYHKDHGEKSSWERPNKCECIIWFLETSSISSQNIFSIWLYIHNNLFPLFHKVKIYLWLLSCHHITEVILTGMFLGYCPLIVLTIYIKWVSWNLH